MARTQPTSLAVLYDVLLKMTVIMAPFTPFFAEYLILPPGASSHI